MLRLVKHNRNKNSNDEQVNNVILTTSFDEKTFS